MGGLVFFLAMLSAGIFAIILLYVLYFSLINFSPSKSKIKTDLKKMKGEITPWINELVPWTREELELLSSNQVKQKVKRGIITTAKGVFTSIYHEPLIAYSYKKYISSKDNAVLYARTSHHEFVYRTQKGQTEIFIDNQKVGYLNEQGLLYGGKKKRLLARINQDQDTLDLPIIVRDKELGTLVKSNAGTVNPRAFQFVSKMGHKEEAVFLSLAVLELVKSSIS